MWTPVPAAFLLLRAGVLKELGAFDESFAETGGETEDLCLRIAVAGNA